MNKETQIPKKHHFVPRCYLKEFLNDDLFYILDIEKIKLGHSSGPRESNQNKICYLEDYYTIPKLENEKVFKVLVNLDKIHIESSVLKNVEDKYEIFKKQLIQDRKVRINEFREFCNFITTLKLRNPWWLDKVIVKNQKEWLETVINGMYDSNEKIYENFITKEQLKGMIVSMVKEDSDFQKKLSLFSIFHRNVTEDPKHSKIIQSLKNSKWGIIEAPSDGPLFITTDNPGFSIGRDNVVHNLKLGNGFIFYLPLSPKYCLSITDDARFKDELSDDNLKHVFTMTAREEEVFFINNNLLKFANRIIIGSDKLYLKKLENEIKTYFSKQEKG